MEEAAMFEVKTLPDESKTISIPVVQEVAKFFHGKGAVPPRYIRDVAENISLNSSIAEKLPTIDMAVMLSQERSEARRHEMQKLSAACQEWGFFQVINHTIPKVWIEKMKRVCREFFHLPLQEKMKCRQTNDLQGYGQAFVALDSCPLEWSDMLYLHVFPENFQKRDVWPQKPHDFGETLIGYVTQMRNLALTFMKLFEEDLGLEAGTLVELCRDFECRNRINYYPPCPRPDQVLGCNSHSDADYLNLLIQDGEAPGLQILKQDEWYTVEPLPDALLVNIGDYLQVMTNGRYRSIEHKAITNKGNDRISVATFCAPNPRETIKPVSALVDDMHPSIYREISVADYLKTFLKVRKKTLLQYLSPEYADTGCFNSVPSSNTE